MKFSKLFGIGDLVLIVLVTVAFVFSFMFVIQTKTLPASVLVFSSGKSYPPLSLTRHKVLNVQGPLGNTRIYVDSGSVRIVDAPCPQHLCMKAGRIRNSGEWIVCIPNRIYIQIRGADSRRLDGVTQ